MLKLKFEQTRTLKQQARSHGGQLGGFKLLTRLKDDSWDLHKSDKICLPLGGGTPAFRDGQEKPSRALKI